MINTKDDLQAAEQAQKPVHSETDTGNAHATSTMSKSMHDGVEVWCDCCSCEAEPYWVEAMQEQNHDK